MPKCLFLYNTSMDRKTIYLDYASTAPRNQFIWEKTEAFSLNHYANIWRWLYTLAEESQEWYQKSKKAVSNWIGCDTVEVIYTYSATYAINLITLAIARNKVLWKWDVIILSRSEHHANIVPWQLLAETAWATIQFVWLDKDYEIDMIELEKLMSPSVKVVSLQYASNVTGAVHDLIKVRNIIGTDCLFFIDATQIVMHQSINMKELWADGIVFSGHKMWADTGIGVLAMTRILQKKWICPLWGGGAINFVTEEYHEQAWIPEKWEPGTPHITGAVSMFYAIQIQSEIMNKNNVSHRELISFTQSQFLALEKKWIIRLFHSNTKKALGIWSFIVPDRHSNDLVESLDEFGICVRSGHHCCEPLHRSLGISGSIRVSIGYHTTFDEIYYFFEKLAVIL